MDSEIKDAIKKVVVYLDSVMEETPSREVADVCNYLSELIEGE